jgi:hypothetical protein
MANFHGKIGTLAYPTPELKTGIMYQVRMDLHVYGRADEPFGADSGKTFVEFDGSALRKYERGKSGIGYSGEQNKAIEALIVSQYGSGLYRCTRTNRSFATQRQLDVHLMKLHEMAEKIKSEESQMKIYHGHMEPYEVYSNRKMLNARSVEEALSKRAALMQKNESMRSEREESRNDFMSMNSKFQYHIRTKTLKEDLANKTERSALYKQKALDDQRRADLNDLTKEVHVQLQFQDYRSIFCANQKQVALRKAKAEKAKLDAQERSAAMEALKQAAVQKEKEIQGRKLAKAKRREIFERNNKQDEIADLRRHLKHLANAQKRKRDRAA